MKNMDVFEKMDFVKECLGPELAFDELCRIIGLWKTEDMLDYIIDLHSLLEFEPEFEDEID